MNSPELSRLKTFLPVPLIIAMILAGLGTCRRTARHMDTEPSRPRFTMEQLDAKAKPFIAEANEAVPKAVAELCSDRVKLFWLLLKDKIFDTADRGRGSGDSQSTTLLIGKASGRGSVLLLKSPISCLRIHF